MESKPFSAATGRAAARAAVAARFRAAGLDSADLDARLLVCAACGLGHLDLVTDPLRPIGVEAEHRLNGFVQRRITHEPVSRILGRREFWSLPFAIAPGVLDPRADTETVVSAVLDALAKRRGEALRLLDLGTGSGAILAALLHELPRAFGVGLDRSAAACAAAAANLKALDLWRRGAIVRGSWIDALAGRFDVVVSNPPYIPSAEIAALAQEVRTYDPRDALDGGHDGLDAYRALAPRLPGLLAPGGVAALECGWAQADDVLALLRSSGSGDAAVIKDLAGNGRVVVARRQR